MRIAAFRNVDRSVVVVFINIGNAVRANVKIGTVRGDVCDVGEGVGDG